MNGCRLCGTARTKGFIERTSFCGLKGRFWCKPPDPEMRIEEHDQRRASKSSSRTTDSPGSASNSPPSPSGTRTDGLLECSAERGFGLF